jgi:2-keto-4-pentenoate hydratase/2-oxohepta-3-ene-1,7-dioic acid hydratase in catechol pathway
MKLATFTHAGKESYGVVDGADIIDLAPLVASASIGKTLKEALAGDKLAEIEAWAKTAKSRIPLTQIKYLPPITNPEKIICIGINYLSHVKETGREIPKYPMIFTRFANSQMGHEQPLVRPLASTKLDFEGELAVVIGRKGRHIKAADAYDYVAGYSCYNDGTLRDWQRHTIQFAPGKNFPATGGFGPWLVTPDEVGDPTKLHLQTRLNGEVVQDAGIDDLIFTIPALIEYCSTFTELEPGDVIITGTTGGVGAFREPPLWMKHGDVIEIEISRVGLLSNTVVDEDKLN